ncbi:MAG: mechanosensitive ion channel family protein [Tannerellaceae bacterium]|jgi:small-conductance mechanosensitive channel|nr:mechanosensitive ion channel family protein [Tannerellaceae bacterium]
MKKLFWVLIFAVCTISSVVRAQSDTLTVTEMPSPVAVVVEGDTLFHLYSGQGGLTAGRRAENAQEAILQTGKSLHFRNDTLHIEKGTYITDIMYGEEVILSITDRDAAWLGITREELAQLYYTPISEKIGKLKKTYGIQQMVKRAGLSILVVAIQILLIKLTNYAFCKLRRRIIRLKRTRLKPIIVRDYEFLDTRRQCLILLFFSQVLKWILILVQLLFSVPMLFSIFPQTKSIAVTLFSYVFEPVKMIFWSVVSYIPNLFIITIIYLCIRYTIKGVRYISQEIESGKLRLNGFYPDWAQPTFNIIRFLLYAFMVAMIYQYLPGSQSDVFKGISVFVGLIVSLGSTTVIGNIIAGFVITYMRPFKIGDRIKLNETEGNVIEKTPFVTRLRTPKNEIVTIPNAFIMSSHTTNYSASAREYGLIIHTNVGFGYEVPWQQVHQLLIRAATETPGVESQPKPFVLETALADSYPIYQINAYVKEADRLSQIYSDLNQRIHDLSHEAGLELLLPHYYAQRDGNPLAMPPEYLKKKPGGNR